jgi:hypothetical protein
MQVFLNTFYHGITAHIPPIDQTLDVTVSRRIAYRSRLVNMLRSMMPMASGGACASSTGSMEVGTLIVLWNLY